MYLFNVNFSYLCVCVCVYIFFIIFDDNEFQYSLLVIVKISFFLPQMRLYPCQLCSLSLHLYA